MKNQFNLVAHFLLLKIGKNAFKRKTILKSVIDKISTALCFKAYNSLDFTVNFFIVLIISK